MLTKSRTHKIFEPKRGGWWCQPVNKQTSRAGREGEGACVWFGCFSFLTFALRVCMRTLWIIDRMTTKTCLHIRIYYTYAFFLLKQTWKIFSDEDDGNCDGGIVTFVSNLLVCELGVCAVVFFLLFSSLSQLPRITFFFSYFIMFRRMKHILRSCQCFFFHSIVAMLGCVRFLHVFFCLNHN